MCLHHRCLTLFSFHSSPSLHLTSSPPPFMCTHSNTQVISTRTSFHFFTGVSRHWHYPCSITLVSVAYTSLLSISPFLVSFPSSSLVPPCVCVCVCVCSSFVWGKLF